MQYIPQEEYIKKENKPWSKNSYAKKASLLTVHLVETFVDIKPEDLSALYKTNEYIWIYATKDDYVTFTPRTLIWAEPRYFKLPLKKTLEYLHLSRDNAKIQWKNNTASTFNYAATGEKFDEYGAPKYTHKTSEEKQKYARLFMELYKDNKRTDVRATEEFKNANLSCYDFDANMIFSLFSLRAVTRGWIWDANGPPHNIITCYGILPWASDEEKRLTAEYLTPTMLYDMSFTRAAHEYARSYDIETFDDPETVEEMLAIVKSDLEEAMEKEPTANDIKRRKESLHLNPRSTLIIETRANTEEEEEEEN
jgi:hypothetical protein